MADVAAIRNDRVHFHLWWLGQSGFLLHWRGRFLLFDPYLSDSLSQKYADTDKPHVRMSERVVAPERLDFVNVVTSSHAHTDHLDKATLAPLLQANPDLKLVIPEANRSWVAQRLDIAPASPIGLDDGRQAAVEGFEIHAVAAAHETLERDERGRHKYLGYVVRFGPWAVYHSGDTVRYPGMEKALKDWRLDVALLPINGRLPERRVAGNLWGSEAARLAKDIGARLAIPCHFDMFEFNTASPEAFIDTCIAIGQPHKVLRGGERWTSAA